MHDIEISSEMMEAVKGLRSWKGTYGSMAPATPLALHGNSITTLDSYLLF